MLGDGGRGWFLPVGCVGRWVFWVGWNVEMGNVICCMEEIEYYMCEHFIFLLFVSTVEGNNSKLKKPAE